MELTKLLRNKELKKKSISTQDEDSKSMIQSNKLALNFEKLLGTAEFANQTGIFTSPPSSRRSERKKEDSILLSAELENLLIAELRKPQNDTEQSFRSSLNNNHTLLMTTELSPYYRRDRRDTELTENLMNNDIADPDGLRELLQVRFEAKKVKDFEQIASLDRQLKLEHGVRVSDYPRLWTTRSDASKASIRQMMRKRHARMKELFGLRGHPYLQIHSPHTTESSNVLLSEGHVHTSLSALTRFQMEGKYDQADAIQFELSLCGIRIHDRLLLWTDDVNLDFEALETIPDRVVHETDYTKEKDDVLGFNATSRREDSYKPRFGGRTMEEDITRRDQRIQQLIRQRSEANARGDAALFSLITLELKSTYWVQMDDERKTWRISKTSSHVDKSILIPRVDHATNYTSSSFAALLFGEDLNEYTSDTSYRQSKKSLPLNNPTHKQRIKELVQERIHLREEGRYLEADAIRRELWHTYVSKSQTPVPMDLRTNDSCLISTLIFFFLTKNVGVNDKLCQYSIGGAYDSDDQMLRKE